MFCEYTYIVFWIFLWHLFAYKRYFVEILLYGLINRKFVFNKFAAEFDKDTIIMTLLRSMEKQGNFLFKYRGQFPIILFLLAVPFMYFTD